MLYALFLGFFIISLVMLKLEMDNTKFHRDLWRKEMKKSDKFFDRIIELNDEYNKVSLDEYDVVHAAEQVMAEREL